MQNSFASYAVNNGTGIWIRDQQPDGNNSVMPVGYWNGRASNSLGESEGRRYRPGIDPAMTFVTCWDYGSGVEAAERDPERYRVDGMPDADHLELLAAAADPERRKRIEAQDRAIQATRGIPA
jgi:hypothetical protein